MNDSLQDTLQTLIQSGTTSNAALNRLINDYADYHMMLTFVGGLFLVSLLLLSFFLWRRSTKVHSIFEKKTYLYFGGISVIVSLFMALIVAANLSSALDARQAFAGSHEMLSTPQTGTPKDQRYQSFQAWVQSGSVQMPSLVQSKINNRLSWQLPKAIICSILLVLLVAICTRVWQTLIRKSRSRQTKWSFRQAALLLSGVVATVIVCFLPMLMVIGNTQASFAPIVLTLFFG